MIAMPPQHVNFSQFPASYSSLDLPRLVNHWFQAGTDWNLHQFHPCPPPLAEVVGGWELSDRLSEGCLKMF